MRKLGYDFYFYLIELDKIVLKRFNFVISQFGLDVFAKGVRNQHTGNGVRKLQSLEKFMII